MPSFRVEIPSECFDRLSELAFRERRPPRWQAEVLLMRELSPSWLQKERPAQIERMIHDACAILGVSEPNR